MNFVLAQILWFVTLILFVVVSFFAVHNLTHIKVKYFGFVLEILACVIVFAYMLAFRVFF